MKGNSYVPFMKSKGDGSTLNLDFTGGSLDSRVVLTRSAATATYINSSGYVTAAIANEARFDYDPTTLAAKGLLIEGQAINILLQSESLATSPWSAQNGATVANVSLTNPAGGATSTQITTGGSGSNSVGQTPTYGAAGAYTLSFWVRSGTATKIQVGIYDGGFVTGTISVLSGSATVSGTSFFTVTNLTSTWTRLQIVYATLSAGAVLIYPDGASPVAGLTVFVWGAQLETGTAASSYIPTVASQVTRNPDLALMTSTNFSSWFSGGTTGTFFVDWYGGVRGITSTVRSVISTSDVPTKHLHLQQVSAAGALKVADSLAAHSVSTANTITSGARTKGAFNFNGATTTVNLCLNGGTVATSSAIAFSVAPTWLVLGGTSTDGSTLTDLTTVLNGSIRQIKYYPTALTNAQLIAMST